MYFYSNIYEMVQSLNLLVEGNHICGTGYKTDGTAEGCRFIGIGIKEEYARLSRVCNWQKRSLS